MNKVDAPTASSPANDPPSDALTIESRMGALQGPSRDHWRLHGDLEAAEALNKKPDVKTAPSLAEPPTEAVVEGRENEPASVPGEKEQPKKEQPKADTKSQKRQERLDNLIEERDRLKAELELLRKLADGTAPQRPAEAAKAADNRPKRPRLQDYETVDAYENAMDAYDDRIRQYDQQQIQDSFRREFDRQSDAVRQRTWAEQVESAKSEFPDFDAVAFNPETPASEVMLRMIQGHKMGTKLAYYLGKHPDEALKIAEASDLTDVQRSDPGRYGYSVGRAEALVEHEFDRILESIAKTASPQKDNNNNARLPKPSAEVSVNAKGSAVEDELGDALSRGDVASFKRIENKRELERIRSGYR